VSLKARSTFVLVNPSEILEALVGLKNVRVLCYERRGPHVELMIEHSPSRAASTPGISTVR
jgi:transposase